MKLGLISDTHGHLDSRALELLRGVDHIVHAGDLGSLAILGALETVAPVTGVLGNCDDLDLPIRETEFKELGGHRLLVHHIVDPLQPSREVRALMEKYRPTLVVFGHTHRPLFDVHQGVTYVNPGSASRPRHGLPASVCRLDLRADGVTPEFLVADSTGRPFVVARLRPGT